MPKNPKKSFGFLSGFLKKKAPFLFMPIHTSHLIYPLVPSLPTKRHSRLAIPGMKSVLKFTKRRRKKSKRPVKESIPSISATLPVNQTALKQLFKFLNSPLPSLFQDLTSRVQKLEKTVPTAVTPAPAATVVEQKAVPAQAPAPEKPASDAASLLGELGTIEKELIDGKLKRVEVKKSLPSDALMASVAEKPVIKEETAAEAAAREKMEAEKKAQAAMEMAAKKEEKTPAPHVEVAAPVIKLKKQNNNGFMAFIASLKYLGLRKERLAIVQSLATMLNAGLSLVDALRALQMETRTKPMKKFLQRVIDAVESGSPLWRAFDDQQFFTPHAISLIRIGEEAGNLAENMEYLSLQQEKDYQLKQKVKMAMIYPVIVLTLMFIIVVGLGMFVLPNLIPVLYSLNVKLPLVTRLLIKFTDLFTNYGVIVIPGSVLGFIVLVILAKFTPLRILTQWVMFHIPGIGRLAREATIARFGVIMGGLLQAGVPLLESIQSLVDVTPIVSYRRFYVKLLEHVSVGDSFSKSFALIHGSAKILPISVQQLIMTGEKSGSLSKIFLKISDIYEKKANDTAQKLPVILEPMLLLFIGGLVGTIAFAIIVPIYSIVGSVGRT